MLKKWAVFENAAEIAKALAGTRKRAVELRWDEDGWVIPSYCSWAGELGETSGPTDSWRDPDEATLGLSPINGESLWEGYEQFSEYSD